MDCLQVYVKTSAFFRISKKAYPFRDAQQLVRELISAYGAHRLMFGTDWPWVEDACG